MLRSAIIFFVLPLMLGACIETTTNESYLPGNSGNQGELLVVASSTFWNSSEADHLRGGLVKLYPGLPADEPLFTSVEVKTEGFVDVFKTHRNILEIRIDPTNETNAVKRNNVYAKQQTVIILTLAKKTDVKGFVDAGLDAILWQFHQAEVDRLASRNRAFGDKSLNDEALDLTGLKIIMQQDFEVANKSNNFLWLRLDREKPIGGFQHQINQGIFIYSRPYLDTAQFGYESLVAWKNKVNKEHIPGPKTSYMQISERFILPTVESINFRGSAAVAMRGLWRMDGAKGVFMGGPFYALSFYNEKDKKQYMVEGYVYGPQFNKRAFIREIEAIVKSASWN